MWNSAVLQAVPAGDCTTVTTRSWYCQIYVTTLQYYSSAGIRTMDFCFCTTQMQTRHLTFPLELGCKHLSAFENMRPYLVGMIHGIFCKCAWLSFQQYISRIRSKNSSWAQYTDLLFALQQQREFCFAKKWRNAECNSTLSQKPAKLSKKEIALHTRKSWCTILLTFMMGGAYHQDCPRNCFRIAATRTHTPNYVCYEGGLVITTSIQADAVWKSIGWKWSFEEKKHDYDKVFSCLVWWYGLVYKDSCENKQGRWYRWRLQLW